MIKLARYFGVGAEAAAIYISLFAFFARNLGYNYWIVHRRAGNGRRLRVSDSDPLRE
jgi:hypothetical protein